MRIFEGIKQDMARRKVVGELYQNFPDVSLSVRDSIRQRAREENRRHNSYTGACIDYIMGMYLKQHALEQVDPPTVYGSWRFPSLRGGAKIETASAIFSTSLMFDTIGTHGWTVSTDVKVWDKSSNNWLEFTTKTIKSDDRYVPGNYIPLDPPYLRFHTQVGNRYYALFDGHESSCAVAGIKGNFYDDGYLKLCSPEEAKPVLNALDSLLGRLAC